MKRILCVCLMFAVFFVGVNLARAEADGPDTWAVTGVAENDILNIRENADADSKKLRESKFNAVELKKSRLSANQPTLNGPRGSF